MKTVIKSKDDKRECGAALSIRFGQWMAQMPMTIRNICNSNKNEAMLYGTRHNAKMNKTKKNKKTSNHTFISGIFMWIYSTEWPCHLLWQLSPILSTTQSNYASDGIDYIFRLLLLLLPSMRPIRTELMSFLCKPYGALCHMREFIDDDAELSMIQLLNLNRKSNQWANVVWIGRKLDRP